jgi:hypothetical protein
MDKLAEHFADLAQKYGPAVADAAKAAAQTEAYSTLMAGVLALAFAVAFFSAGLFIWKQIDSPSNRDGWADEWAIASIVLWTVALISFSLGLWSLVDPWTWTTIYHPELWLAKKAFGL